MGADPFLLSSIRNDPSAAVPTSRFYGDAWKYLFEGLPASTVQFGANVKGIKGADTTTPRLVLGDENKSGESSDDACRAEVEVEFDLIIGADGGKSVVRQYVAPGQDPKYSGYMLWRGMCPLGPRLPDGSAKRNGFRYDTGGFQIRGPRGPFLNCGMYCAMSEAEAPKVTKNRQVKDAAKVPDWFIPFVRKMFGERNAQFWKQCKEKGKIAPHPVWEFAADKVVNHRVLILGDAAHMASPRTGAGAYTAMADAMAFYDAMKQLPKVSIDSALALYNTSTVSRGKALYQRSRQIAQIYAPDGRIPISPSQLV